ncbi:MAG TPA: hypothetical protein VEZ72_11070, partial [Paenibacillus sp.]|nr:hypothetical protein [Paenibacillus sp.]
MKKLGMMLAACAAMFLTSAAVAQAETLEEQLNNLVGPKQQYGTFLSPVYLRTNETEEYISPQSGELTLTQTDFVLPGRNGLDLEIKRIYKGGISNVQEMKVKYVNGAWVDYADSDAKTTSFYEERYNLGIGMRFSFPMMEVRANDDGTSHKFLHTESGDVYRLKAETQDGKTVYLPEGQTIKDVVVTETTAFTNGQADGTSAYVMTDKAGKKTYFTSDGRIVGIVDRYDNRIVFEYEAFPYTVDGHTTTRKLITKITDTVGRVVTLQYKEDATFKVGPITAQNYSAEERYKASQHPNKTDSGDLQNKFQVVVGLPSGQSIVYDKSAVLVSPSKHVLRTRLQRVYDMDGLPKYHYWYEQPDLGFTYMNGTSYSAFNRHENLVQIDYVKTNELKRYKYDSFTKSLHQGSMQYRKIFEQSSLAKTGYDASKSDFLERFAVTVVDKTTFAYTNEADGFGTAGYLPYNQGYLRDVYRYYTTVTDANGSTTKHTYDGLHQLLVTERQGADHREEVRTERDEMKLVKKQETLSFHVEGGKPVGEPVRKIENYRYDEYGNLTNYTGPEAARDASGTPVNTEHTVIYTYAYDKFHALSSKTWKTGPERTSQTIFTIDAKGNATKETRKNGAAYGGDVEIEYAYDTYGNLTRRTARTAGGGQSFVTHYEYGVDANGTDTKGAYLTREYTVHGDDVSATRYAYDWATGNRVKEIDPNGSATASAYDGLNRLVKRTYADGGEDIFEYKELPFSNFTLTHQDPNGVRYEYEYDILGGMLRKSLWKDGAWHVLERVFYDGKGNKTKEIDANGHSVRYAYDSAYRLAEKSVWDKDTVQRGSLKLRYRIGAAAGVPLRVTLIDEEGYEQRFDYDALNRLVRHESTPDRVTYYATTYTYDYVGNKTSETNARQATTQYVYDDLGRLALRKDALGYETAFRYNALDQTERIAEPGGKVTTYVFDGHGRTVRKTVGLAAGTESTYEAYTYDLAGNVTRKVQGAVRGGTDVVSSDVSYAYDKRNRVTDEYAAVDAARVAHTKHTYDKAGNVLETVQYANAAKSVYRVFAYTYDFAGRRLEETGALVDKSGATPVERGRYRTVSVRDLVGNVVEERVWNGTAFETTTLAYDHRNQLVEKLEPFGAAGSGETKRTAMSYDKVGRLLTETVYVGGRAETTSYALDGLGRATKKTDPLGQVFRYLFDEVGNKIKEIDPRYIALSDAAAPGVTYEYDALNRLVRTSVFDGATSTVVSYKEYDGRGNVVKDVAGEGYDAAEPHRSLGVSYTYDANNRVVAIVSAQTAALNRANGTQHVSGRYTYDGSGQVTAETDALGRTTQYTYTLNGLLREKTYPDGLKESYEYDLTGLAWSKKTDRAGRVSTAYMTVFNAPYLVTHPDGASEQFRYSAKGEVLEKIDPAGNSTYFVYDASGNAMSEWAYIEQDGSQSVYRLNESRYDEANRLLSTETFLVRSSGLPTAGSSKASAGNKVEREYDRAGRLQRVVGPFGRETAYRYDATGN